MAEWICNLEDDEVVGELRTLLATFDYFTEEFQPSDRIEFLVGHIKSPNLKIEIFADEHPPPHFRVKYAGETANYQISDCQQLNGGLRRYKRVIREWHSKNKLTLIEKWDTSRPSDCPVGQYSET